MAYANAARNLLSSPAEQALSHAARNRREGTPSTRAGAEMAVTEGERPAKAAADARGRCSRRRLAVMQRLRPLGGHRDSQRTAFADGLGPMPLTYESCSDAGVGTGSGQVSRCPLATIAGLRRRRAGSGRFRIRR